MEKRNLRKERIGVVSSNKGDKTITVMVKWKEKHPIYGKFVNKTKKYHAHDEKNECSIGDTVRLMETRPLSKMNVLMGKDLNETIANVDAFKKQFDAAVQAQVEKRIAGKTPSGGNGGGAPSEANAIAAEIDKYLR